MLNQIKKSYSYIEYRAKIKELIDSNSCSGEEQTVDKIKYTKLNTYRMSRIEKQFGVNDELERILENISCKFVWVVLTESWCGDAAQNLPVLAKIADMTPNIELKIIFRNANPKIMDHYLTNGSRSIPKLICFNKSTGKEAGTWGPRPIGIKSMVNEYKKNNPDASHEEFLTNLHLCYGRNRSKALQNDIITLLNQWSEKCKNLEQYESAGLIA